MEPQIIVDEGRMRDLTVAEAPNGGPIATASRLEPVAAENLMAAGRRRAIRVDGHVVADPIIRAPVAAVEGARSGGYSKPTADAPVALLRNRRLDARAAVLSRAPAPCAQP